MDDFFAKLFTVDSAVGLFLSLFASFLIWGLGALLRSRRTPAQERPVKVDNNPPKKVGIFGGLIGIIMVLIGSFILLGTWATVQEDQSSNDSRYLAGIMAIFMIPGLEQAGRFLRLDNSNSQIGAVLVVGFTFYIFYNSPLPMTGTLWIILAINVAAGLFYLSSD